ncbi:eta DNA polymerase [Lentinula aciculospora]|uniref:DNA polymerase eta n=1 Tax=Lentinula aciculospora TaxID=153920 RepID=A0A9W9DPN7_9AGAR|nr:eta DNA polymerase [Lentinula aciculospora]
MIPTHRKGKGKAQDFDDLDPVITYRHILQNNLGTRDPLRVVALCDSDAFYAACEMVRLGVTDKPLIVLQWEGIIAVNYPARKFGITRFHKLKDAKERCPELMIVHVATYKEGEAEPGYWDKIDSRTHKVSLDYYRRESAKVLAMFKERLPDAEIAEKASIDEAFIDFTKPVRQALLHKYPFLSQIPPDAPDGADTPLPPPPLSNWGTNSHLVPIIPNADSETTSEEELQSTPSTWHDVALQLAAEMMHKVRVDIATKLGYTTSAGIARNKFLAKLCASYRKPYSQTILRNQAIPSYLKPLEFQKIRFLGGKLGEALAKEYDVSTVADLLYASIDYSAAEELQTKFGESALWVYEILRYAEISLNDFQPDSLREKSPFNKSMLAAKALHKPITKAADGPHWIRVLAAELALRLNDARRERPNLWPKTLVLHAGHGKIVVFLLSLVLSLLVGYGTARSKQAPFPFAQEVTVDVIAAAGNKLWKELVGNVTGHIKVTNISLGFTGIETTDASQQSIAGFLAGTSTVTGVKRRSGEGENGSSPKRSHRDTQRARSRPLSPTSAGQNVTSFACSECHKTFSLSPKILSLTSDARERSQALDAMKDEHSDFHFAQSVAREVEPVVKRVGSSKKVEPAKTEKKESTLKGIEKFFNRT